jgi:hypothetical protein
VLENAKQVHPEASDVDGYGEAAKEDQAKLVKAWREIRVAEEDIPASARKNSANGSDKDKLLLKKRGSKQKVCGQGYVVIDTHSSPHSD